MKIVKVWDSHNKEWLENVDIIVDDYGQVSAGDANNPPMVPIEPENVFWNTRAKDKNGGSIFDGSIITWESETLKGKKIEKGVVKWSEDTEHKGNYLWIVITKNEVLSLSGILRYYGDSVTNLKHSLEEE